MKALFILLLFCSTYCFSQLDSLNGSKIEPCKKWMLSSSINYWTYYPSLELIGVECHIERRILSRSKIDMSVGLGYNYSLYLQSIPLYLRAQYNFDKRFSPFWKLSYPLLQNRTFFDEDIDITKIFFNTSIGLNYNFKRSVLSVGFSAWFIQRTDFQYPYDTGPKSLGFLPVAEIGYGWRF